ncbi:hypothetical protein CC1G_04575 [Coprinopsis cinerea okayama7|uniref:Uncharacterized protein n=1 Tax=Coprinopsis cinerea (strain Okayama-7 / 130 / ATCC MYA-4618 / FGSC 9003) TaxID=240176 RepID=A8N5J7_COPC7|nr:hypothetical protein CC1G_04575 [Coprinopsis cinerea okayama7\|eukprot:XP_001830142.2 hypothetical protein CC1G_04575 [Coprinopsis cinerea okayama7\
MVSFQDAATSFIESNSMRHRSINPRKSRRLATDFGLDAGRGAPPEPPLLWQPLRRPRLASSPPLYLVPIHSVEFIGRIYRVIIVLQPGSTLHTTQGGAQRGRLREFRGKPNETLEGGRIHDLIGLVYTTSALSSVGREYQLLVDKASAMDMAFPYRASDDIQTLQSDDTSSYGSLALSQRARLRTRGLDFEMVGEALIELDMNSPRARPEVQEHMDSRASWAHRSNRKTWTTDDLLQWSVSHRMQARESMDISEISVSSARQDRRPAKSHVDNRRYTLCASRPKEATIEKPPKVIRKVASMHDRTKQTDKSTQRPIQKIKSLRLFPSSSRRDLNRNGETKHRNWLFSRTSHRQNTSSADYGKTVVRPPPNRTPYPSYSAQEIPSITRSRTTYSKRSGAQQRDSVWLTGLGFSFTETRSQKDGNASLDDPISFVAQHHGTHLTAAKSHGNLPDTLDTSESFICITPDKAKGDKPAERKTKVQKLIARVSNGFLGWGRQLTSRRHQSPGTNRHSPQ